MGESGENKNFAVKNQISYVKSSVNTTVDFCGDFLKFSNYFENCFSPLAAAIGQFFSPIKQLKDKTHCTNSYKISQEKVTAKVRKSYKNSLFSLIKYADDLQ